MADKPTPSSGPPDTSFFRLDPRLQALETQIVYVGIPDRDGKRSWWNIWGPNSGIQGVQLGPQVAGLMHAPFDQLLSEGAYQVGAVFERVIWRKRDIGLKVLIGVQQPDTIFRYRMVEQRWWASWSATEDGYLGVFTRTHGWRWLKVRLGATPPTMFELDPAANGNNYMEWDMTATAADPFWRQRIESKGWVNDGTQDDEEGPSVPHTPWDQLEQLIENILKGLIPGVTDLIPGKHIGEGNIVIPNRGDQVAWPKFLISSPGRTWIQDGPGGRMVELPLLHPDDGVVLVDTDPMARTLTASKDPVDPLFYRIARNSQLLDFFLHDITDSGLPVWRRFNDRFTVPWPAKTLCRIKVQHSNAGGSVTALMPQKFGMAYA